MKAAFVSLPAGRTLAIGLSVVMEYALILVVVTSHSGNVRAEYY